MAYRVNTVEDISSEEIEELQSTGIPRIAEHWFNTQVINSTRHALGLKNFSRRDFGDHVASPSAGQIKAINDMISPLKKVLRQNSEKLSKLSKHIQQRPGISTIEYFTRVNESAGKLTKEIETIWDFYLELFNQRNTAVKDRLRACDLIAQDCYQSVYTGLGKARSIPSPAPFSFLETAFAPATFRRGVRMRSIGRRKNPFPLIKLPYHRLVNPWTLGAIPHEVSHNLQSDLGLWDTIPKQIYSRLSQCGMPKMVVHTWSRWHKELFADFCGLLLIGPAFVASLMDIVAKSPQRTLYFNPKGVHPVPYLRVFICLELLKEMQFHKVAKEFQKSWGFIYPSELRAFLPKPLLKHFEQACKEVVRTICFTPYEQLGGKSLAQVVRFEPKDLVLMKQAGERLAQGHDPGILPVRHFIGASRFALDNKLESSNAIAENFYQILSRR